MPGYPMEHRIGKHDIPPVFPFYFEGIQYFEFYTGVHRTGAGYHIG